ncbi:MAG: GNAT family N-acetyltransferase [Candidatus Eremiobacteraeota bacterium]|nr:GNAT family N-acetyltransferase [Candidatus Eremiobacteraeota bacterium]
MIRSFRHDDVESIARHGNNPEIARYLADRFPMPYTVVDARDWINHAMAAEPEHYFAIDVGGEAVGGIGWDPLEDVERFTGDFGYWLSETLWGRGIATAAVLHFYEWMFERTNLERIQAWVMEPNTASVRVLEKAGFLREGTKRRAIYKNGAFCDALTFARVRA